LNLQRAIEIAVEAHRGQVDKAGNLYVLHPLRVMMSLDTEDEKIVGVLHDVVEDCEGWTWDRLRSKGFSDKIIDALQSVSKAPEEEAEFKRLKKAGSEESVRDHYFAFIKRAAANEIGRKVKAADITDNLDISRINSPSHEDILRLKRYEQALRVLGSSAENERSCR
jgi:(p)ppGpp synthase/HD superfamily hydrolase